MNSSVQEKVVHHLKHALEVSPDHLPSFVALSEFYLKFNNFPEVLKLLENTSHDSESTQVSFIKAKLYNRLKDYEKASQAITICTESDSSTVDQLKLAVEIEQNRENDAAVIEHLEVIIDKDPLDGNSHFLLAEKIVTADQYDKKRLLLEISVSLLPHDPAPLVLLGEHLLIGEKTMQDGTITQTPNYSEAEKNLLSAIEIDPMFEKAYYLRGKIMLQQGKHKEAQEQFKKCTKENEFQYLANIEMGKAKLNENTFSEAKPYFEGAQKIQKNEYYPAFKLGIINLKEEKYLEARIFLEDSMNRAEKELSKMEKRSDEFLKGNRFNQARRVLKNINEVKENLSVIHLSIHQIILKLSDEFSFSHLDRSLEYNPHNSNSLYEKGRQFIDSDKDTAINYWQRSVEADWFNWKSHFELAKVNFVDKKLDSARTHIEIANDLIPEHDPVIKLMRKIEKN